jgi:hypothetical protein
MTRAVRANKWLAVSTSSTAASIQRGERREGEKRATEREPVLTHLYAIKPDLRERRVR